MKTEAQILEQLAKESGGVMIHRNISERGGTIRSTITRIVVVDEVPQEHRTEQFQLYIVYDNVAVDEDGNASAWREYRGVHSVADAAVSVPTIGEGKYTLPVAERLAYYVAAQNVQ